ncbi:MAG TPA: carbamoyl phosphate synthase small subunit [Candidatus Ligilactobacillus excrementigallinarum]|uniref:Carbamoyl phosphate synthase small chain n=1 Tax=Candidatus Ligilactobacillus excrementigallinarum TaxID=2838641 RepID=A0A9D2AAM5_9LACO|nr:carbamoyl phosphate synthase small subunit [Candidatus Ligilactobacillus excrementigallinarum]
MKRYLVLEDGNVFEGEAFGSKQIATGEVVFSTGMTGYQEAITDQSYANQILVFTNPLIGNYGVNLDDYESLQPKCRGVVCRELARVSSSWRKQDTLDHFLKQNSIPGISGIDTRKLTRIIRSHGTMKGCLVNSIEDKNHTIEQLKATVLTDQLVDQVSTQQPYPNPGTNRNIVVVDFGAKHSILRELSKRNCNTIVVPYTTTADEILKLHPDGVLLSNGPGDPESLPNAIQMIKEILGKLPIMGICLGHQLLCLACGAQTFKMKFGHRGFNHPVREIATGEIMFTSQNHGYAVNPESLKDTNLMITHLEINDQTVEGVKHRNYPAFSVQFHPDAAPGPHDADNLYGDFMQMIDSRKEEF